MFNGNGADSSGNGFDASINDTPTFGPDRFGNPNCALSVQSANDIALIPAGAFANFIYGTISMWVKTTDTSYGQYYWSTPCFFGSDLSGFIDSAFGIVNDSGTLEIWGQLHTYDMDNSTNSAKVINDNKWHLVVATINDNGICNLYVDAVYAASILSGSPLAQRVYAIMGKGPSRGPCLQTGFVDDVRIYDHILSECDILNLYNSSSVVANPVSLGNDLSVCANSKVIFNPTISSCLTPLSYTWTANGDTLSCTNCLNPSVILTQNSTYILQVTFADSSSASDTINYTISGTNSALSLSMANSNISCNQLTDISIATVSGGIAPINYSWGDGSDELGIATQVHYYNDAGVYIISATDSVGCTSSVIDTITNLGIVINVAQITEPSCIEDSSGMIKVSVTGGQAPYSYSWVTGGTADSIVGIMVGDYSLTITDANSCSAVFYQSLSPVHDKWTYYSDITVTNANCTNNGAISSFAAGGASPYRFLWSTGDTAQNLQNLGAGQYNLTVTDADGCQRRADGVINFNCVSLISGTLFVDANNNCIIDSGESPVPFAIVTAYANGIYYYTCSDWSGNYTLAVPDSGTYYLQANIWDGFCESYVMCGDSNQTIFLSYLGDSSFNNNFAFSGSSGFDLTLHPGWTSADPGFDKEYWVMPYNQSNYPYYGAATVTFIYDSNLIYLSSLSPLPTHDPVAHSLTWAVDSLPYPSWDWYNERFQNFFHVPDTLSLGYLLQSDFYITPTIGDCDSSNNHLHFSETVIGSHDPNEKSVVPANNISPDDSVLTYTIHFQNTGTDSTWFITVQDTLSSYLDPSSVRNIASSAPYSNFTIQGRGVLTWTFDPFRLVDSLTNPRGSQGFVTFSVKKRAGLLLGTTIRNTGYVYFDYNDAVITNTVSDTLAIALSIPTIQANNGINVTAFPNPFNNYTNFVVTGISGKYDFQLYDVTGRLSQSIASVEGSQFKVTKGDLAAGMYFFRILVAGKQAAYGKLVIE